jgi:hypothetical protein
MLTGRGAFPPRPQAPVLGSCGRHHGSTSAVRVQRARNERSIAKLAFVLLMCVAARTARAQLPRTVQLHGHVYAETGQPMPGVTVSALSLPDSSRGYTLTADDGSFSVSVATRAQDFVIAGALPGYTPVSVSVHRASRDDDLDVRLVMRALQRMAPVRVRSQRPRPPSEEDRRDVGPGESPKQAGSDIVDLSSGLTGSIAGDLTLALGSLPGVSVVPSSASGLPAVSVFGLSPDQNSQKLNGMNFLGGGVPREGISFQGVPRTYDPGTGGFGGLLASVRVIGGTNRHVSLLHYSIATPVTTGISTISGSSAKSMLNVLSGAARGAAIPGRLYYAFSYQGAQQAGSVPSLGALNVSSLASLGLSPDSIALFLAEARRKGLYAQGTSGEISTGQRQGSVYSRIDLRTGARTAEPNAADDDPLRSENDYSLVVGGAVSTAATPVGSFGLPSVGASSRQADGTVVARATHFSRGGLLNETSIGLSARRDAELPFSRAPLAIISSASPVSGAATTYHALLGGGIGAGSTAASHTALDVKNELSFYNANGRHRPQLTVETTADGFTSLSSQSPGAFTFSSVGAFAADSAASFRRLLGGTRGINRIFGGAIGIGDTYARRDGISQFAAQLGIRFETNVLDDPVLDPTVRASFGADLDRVPIRSAILPMLGVTKSFGRLRPGPDRPDVARGNVFGGIRQYHGSFASIAPMLAAGSIAGSGLQQLLSCDGSAVPAPVWSDFLSNPANIPETCSGGTPDVEPSNVRPTTHVIAPTFQPVSSWRTNLGISDYLTPNWWLLASSTLADNSHLPSDVDANLTRKPRFALVNEGGRPVFAPPAAFDPATGKVNSSQSRAIDSFGPIQEMFSDLRGQQWSTTVGLSRQTPAPSVVLPFSTVTLFYTFSTGESQQRGLASSTAGDPRVAEWAPIGVPAHAVSLAATFHVPSFVDIDLFARLSSGIAYTPLVAGDVNGDDAADDRAFVFNPAADRGSATSLGIANLLATAPVQARRCLEPQLGQIAKLNSCRAGWTSVANLRVSINSYRLGLGNRASVGVLFQNLGAALDRLLHGPDHPHGWGAFPIPDPNLLVVRGFDASRNRFRYDVNQGFGRGSPFSNTLEPARLALDVHLDLGPDRETEAMVAFLAGRGAIKDLSITDIKSRLAWDRNTLVDRVVTASDSLNVDTGQRDALSRIRGGYLRFRDSAYTQLALYLHAHASAPHRPDVRDAWHCALTAVAERQRSSLVSIRQTLSLRQFEMLSVRLRREIEASIATSRVLLRAPQIIPP